MLLSSIAIRFFSPDKNGIKKGGIFPPNELLRMISEDYLFNRYFLNAHQMELY
jgi:hypothetical protein